jgi:hypothetical protein
MGEGPRKGGNLTVAPKAKIQVQRLQQGCGESNGAYSASNRSTKTKLGFWGYKPVIIKHGLSCA